MNLDESYEEGGGFYTTKRVLLYFYTGLYVPFYRILQLDLESHSSCRRVDFWYCSLSTSYSGCESYSAFGHSADEVVSQVVVCLISARHLLEVFLHYNPSK